VADTHAVLQATALALPASPVFPRIAEAQAKLAQILSSGGPQEEQNAAALMAVDPLRRYLAGGL
jgi:hypothetical protein